GATLPRLIAAIVLCCSRCASARARQVSPAASAAATASLWVASEEATVCEKVGVGGGAACFPPHALRQSAAPTVAPSSRPLVRLIRLARGERRAPTGARARASRSASSRSGKRRDGTQQTFVQDR